MHFLKFSFVLVILSVILPWPIQPTAAKGLMHRVVISSKILPEDIIVTEKTSVTRLSMAHLEVFTCHEKSPDKYCGEIEAEPIDIADGYTLERQYQSDTDQFLPLDKVIYYPSTTPDQRGYVHYLGLANGSTGYDDNWYYVSIEAEAALQRILNTPNLKDYLLVADGNGNLTFLDPHTLDSVGDIYVNVGEWRYITAVGVDASGQKLILNLIGNVTETREVDLVNQTHCSLGIHQWIGTSFDGQAHLYMIGNKIEVRAVDTLEVIAEIELKGNQFNFFPSGDNRLLYGIDYAGINASLWQIDLQDFTMTKVHEIEADNQGLQGMDDQDFGVFYLTDGVEAWSWEEDRNYWQSLGTLGLEAVMPTITEINQITPIGTRHGTMFLHNRLGRYWRYDDRAELPGGIFLLSPFEGDYLATWHADISFAQVIYNNNSLYGLANMPEDETATLYRMDADSEAILNQVTLPDGVHFIRYIQLDSEFAEVKATFTACDTPYFEMPDFVISTPPSTATPTK